MREEEIEPSRLPHVVLSSFFCLPLFRSLSLFHPLLIWVAFVTSETGIPLTHLIVRESQLRRIEGAWETVTGVVTAVQTDGSRFLSSPLLFSCPVRDAL